MVGATLQRLYMATLASCFALFCLATFCFVLYFSAFRRRRSRPVVHCCYGTLGSSQSLASFNTAGIRAVEVDSLRFNIAILGNLLYTRTENLTIVTRCTLFQFHCNRLYKRAPHAEVLLIHWPIPLPRPKKT